MYNETERLRTCLSALADQTYPRDRFEVIIVDNGSSESPRGIVDSFSFCKLVEEPQPGAYAARNRGLQFATGELLAFTDADCIPDRNWLTVAARELISDSSCAFVGGGVEIFPAKTGKPTAIELYDMIFGLNQQNCIECFGYAVTANLITRRETMNRVGEFDARVKSLGDREWGQRATALGLPGRYIAAALIRHPARNKLSSILTQARRFAGGRFDHHRDRPYQYRSWHFWKMVGRAVFPHVTRMRQAFVQLRSWGYGIVAWSRVTVVILVVQYVQLWEMGRKWRGRSSERR